MRTRILLVVALALVALPLCAQAQTIAIRGAKVYTLAGPPIENGTVLIRDGKIAAVGADVAVPSGAQVIDGKGLHVYPGLFDAFSQLGLVEVESVSATIDTTELGPFNPQLNTATAVHPASDHIPVARANGITHAVSAPAVGGGGGGGGFGGGGGTPSVVRGQASAINLDGWVIDEMLVKRTVGLVMVWPTLGPAGGGGFGGGGGQQQRRPFSEVRQEYERRVAEISSWFDAARHYMQAVEKGSKEKFERDLKFEAMIPVLKGGVPILVSANRARDIKNAVEWCEKEKVKMILAGGGEAWKVKDLLKQKNIPVILSASQALPMSEDDPYDKPYSRAAELHAAGVKIAFATFNSADSRTLPYEAGQSVPFGLPWEEAVKAITLYPAQMLGLADRLGTIEPGKMANLVVTTGDVLELRTQVRHVIIGGKRASLDNRHDRLYETYKKR